VTGPHEREISIRRATTADAAAVLACLRLAFEPYRDRYTPDAFADTVLDPASIRRRLAEMRVYVATTTAGDVVGTVGCIDVSPEEGHLRGMAVDPNVLGTGVAQQLLDAVLNDLEHRGCSRVSLDTTPPLERAVRFYQRNGFRASGVVGDFFGMPLVEYVIELPGSEAALAKPR
jgi:ribosomal protein S18 acetylase RimI-like enzyme